MVVTNTSRERHVHCRTQRSPTAAAFLIAVVTAWPALAEPVTKTVTYNGTKMEMTGTDDGIEIKDETGKIFVRGKWDSETVRRRGRRVFVSGSRHHQLHRRLDDLRPATGLR